MSSNHNYEHNEPEVVSIDMDSIGGMDNFGFYDSGSYEVNTSQSQLAESSSGLLTVNASSFGKAGHFLENKGFGWLLEAKEDNDSQTPLLEELDIDLTDIYYKIRCVLLPLPYFRMKLNIVRESPDFWGPLGVVLAFSMLSIYGQISVISWILTMWFCGGFMVYFIARALGGDVGYSQVLGVIGYCLIPLVFTGFFSSLLSRFQYISSVFGMLGVIWSVYSSGTLLCGDELQSKKLSGHRGSRWVFIFSILAGKMFAFCFCFFLIDSRSRLQLQKGTLVLNKKKGCRNKCRSN